MMALFADSFHAPGTFDRLRTRPVSPNVSCDASSRTATAADFCLAKIDMVDMCTQSNLREQMRAARFEPKGSIRTEELMRKLAITLLAGAGALFVGSANASDLYTSSEHTNSDLLQPVRMICHEDGRCYRTRGGSRVIIRDSYDYYAPRERYIERRGYRDWDDGPRAGVGIRAPGVSVGVGVGGDRW
jgi:hypothetical protein